MFHGLEKSAFFIFILNIWIWLSLPFKFSSIYSQLKTNKDTSPDYCTNLNRFLHLGRIDLAIRVCMWYISKAHLYKKELNFSSHDIIHTISKLQFFSATSFSSYDSHLLNVLYSLDFTLKVEHQANMTPSTGSIHRASQVG